MAESVRQNSVSVLIVDDSTEDTELIVLQLRRDGFAPTFRRVDSRSGMIAALEEQGWDLVLCDYMMPQFDPADALAILQERRSDTPFLIVSGTLHDETAVGLMRRGARDIIMKANLARLGPVVRRELEAIAARRGAEKARRESERAEEALRENEKRFRALIENSSDGFLLLDLKGRVIFSDPPILGYSAAELRGRKVFEFIHREDLKQIVVQSAQVLKNAGEVITSECRVQHKDGSWRWIEAVSRNSLDNPTVGAMVVNYRDITERKRLEEQLRQTQRLESLGVLAGGVAHDFNNLLTGILGNASLALSVASLTSPDRPFLQEVIDATERAANLTRQLLAYAGKGAFIIREIDLSQFVRDSSELIRMSISRNVELQFDLSSDLPPIDADIGQVQQVFMNLVSNAAEAIAEGKPGTVLVATKVQDVVEDMCRWDIHADYLPNGIVPGRYVVLEVQDTGCGMNEATQARIFDPFFTTKFFGRGLGLSAVQGIVRRHKGFLRVHSGVGRGTTFKVFFPAGRLEPIKAECNDRAEDLSGTETVLVVDDEPAVRQVAKNTLERYGYTIVVADNGRTAVDLFQAMADRISLVLLDLTMPVMGGEETLLQLRKIRADVPVILSSGFGEAEALLQFGHHGLASFIQKPYTAVRLAEKVKTVLGEL